MSKAPTTGHVIWTEMDALHEVAGALEKPASARPRASSWRGSPISRSTSTRATPQTLIKLIDALDDDDDVQTVWGNYEVSDEIMEKLG